jgi:hypothetical protein
MTKTELYELLKTAVTQPFKRGASIQQFQKAVFEGDAEALGLSQREWDVFSQLAQDLDYYEPNHERRSESTLFYGNDKVVREIEDALSKIHEIQA